MIFLELDYKSIGRRIKLIRQRNKLSQEQLAELTDLTPAHVSHIETANTRTSLSSLMKIANALHTSLDDLVYENMVHNKHISVKELDLLISDCDDREIAAIVEMARTTIHILRNKNK